mmetsp:Transcript_21191/g.41136  ORF Transcript_21191/g.41136 Transcript_21191/m.41136 type:complete len:1305 (-) Transcript_21191:142-4056(-)
MESNTPGPPTNRTNETHDVNDQPGVNGDAACPEKPLTTKKRNGHRNGEFQISTVRRKMRKCREEQATKKAFECLGLNAIEYAEQIKAFRLFSAMKSVNKIAVVEQNGKPPSRSAHMHESKRRNPTKPPKYNGSNMGYEPRASVVIKRKEASKRDSETVGDGKHTKQSIFGAEERKMYGNTKQVQGVARGGLRNHTKVGVSTDGSDSKNKATTKVPNEVKNSSENAGSKRSGARNKRRRPVLSAVKDGETSSSSSNPPKKRANPSKKKWLKQDYNTVTNRRLRSNTTADGRPVRTTRACTISKTGPPKHVEAAKKKSIKGKYTSSKERTKDITTKRQNSSSNRNEKRKSTPERPRRNIDVNPGRLSRPKVRKKNQKGEFQVGNVVEAIFDDGEWYDVEITRRHDFYTFDVIWLDDSRKHKQKIMGQLQYWDMRPKTKEPKFRDKEALRSKLVHVVWELRRLPHAWPFREPVDREVAPDYDDRIERPMDLLSMKKKALNGEYKEVESFAADFHLMVENCSEYNGNASQLAYLARSLRTKYREIMRQHFPRIRIELIETNYKRSKKKSAVQRLIAEIKGVQGSKRMDTEKNNSVSKTRNATSTNPKRTSTNHSKAERTLKSSPEKLNRKRKKALNVTPKLQNREEPLPRVDSHLSTPTVELTEDKNRALELDQRKQKRQLAEIERKKKLHKLHQDHMKALGLLPLPKNLSVNHKSRLQKLYASVSREEMAEEISIAKSSTADKDLANAISQRDNSAAESESSLQSRPKRRRTMPIRDSFANDQAFDSWIKLAIERSKVEVSHKSSGETTKDTADSNVSSAQSKKKLVPAARSGNSRKGPTEPKPGKRVRVRFDDGEQYGGIIGACGLLCKNPNIWRLYIKYDDGESLYDVFPDPKQGIEILETKEEMNSCPLAPGDRCDCMDSAGNWLPATVIEQNKKDSHLLHIHFIGWSNRWDEWVSMSKEPERFAPLYNFAKPTLKLLKLCPLPPPPPEPVVGLNRLPRAPRKTRHNEPIRSQELFEWGFARNELVTDRHHGQGTVVGIQDGKLIVQFDDTWRKYTKPQALHVLRRSLCHHCERGDFEAGVETCACGAHFCHSCIRTLYSSKFKRKGRTWKCPKCRGCCKCSRCKPRAIQWSGMVSEPDVAPDPEVVKDTMEAWLPGNTIDIPGVKKVDILKIEEEESSDDEDTSDETYYVKHTREYRAECRFWQQKENERQQAFFHVDDKALDDTQMRKIERLKRNLLGSTESGQPSMKKKSKKKKKGRPRKKDEENQERIVIPKSLSLVQRFNYTCTATRWRKPERYIKCTT